MSQEQNTFDYDIFFKGQITDAIAKAKGKGRILVVYIKQESSEKCENFEQNIWTNNEVKKRLEDDIVLKLVYGTQDTQNFMQIYPVPYAPCVYFIGPSGKPLNVVLDPSPEPSNFIPDIEKAQNALQQQFTPDTANAADSPSSLNSTPTFPSSSNNTNNNNNQFINSEKKQKLKEQIAAARRRQQEKKFKGSQKSTSHEPHNNDTKESGSSSRFNSISQSSNKTKKDNNNNNNNKTSHSSNKNIKSHSENKSEKFKQKELKEKQNESQELYTGKQKKKEEKSDKLALQFRLTDGSTLKTRFPPSATLKDCRKEIDSRRTDGSCKYKIRQGFPPKTFSLSEENQTLESLEILNHSSFFLEPEHSEYGHVGSHDSSNGRSSWFGGVFNWFSGVFGGGGGEGGDGNGSQEQQGPRMNNGARGGSSSNSSSNSSKFRTLHDIRNEEGQNKNDDQYWNGNSTQFQDNDNNNNQ